MSFGIAYIDPIAGTTRRTGNPKEDEELASALLANPKENAEHVMLVDLGRNDLVPPAKVAKSIRAGNHPLKNRDSNRGKATDVAVLIFQKPRFRAADNNRRSFV